MRVAVIGAGLNGLGAALELAKAGVNVVIYEKEESLVGHAKTVTVDGVDLDLGFMVFNPVTCLNTVKLFESLGIDMETSYMSFSVSLDEGCGYEWGSRNGLTGLFAQKKNALNPYFWRMLQEIVKFKHDVLMYLEEVESKPDRDHTETLGKFVKSRGYSELFQRAYLVPMCGSIWSCPSEQVMSFSAFSILSFCHNHHLLQLFGHPQGLTLMGHSHFYVNKVREELESRGCQIRTNCEVHAVSTGNEGCTVFYGDGLQDYCQGCIVAVHAPDAVRILGQQATYDEVRILGAFEYVYSDVFLHCDKNLMPRAPAAWSAWNFLGSTGNKVCLTFWLNVLLNIGESTPTLLVTLNPSHIPENTFLKCLLEDGGNVFTFDGKIRSALKAVLRVHNTQFYWKVATQAGLGLADAYINGDFSFADKNEGLVNFLMILIANRDLNSWIASARYFYKHVLRKNTLTQARRNISRHYDLSNEMFGLFLDETMTYSCALFESANEDLKVAQLRKISSLIKKAQISKMHEILEIGCGWGSFAIEVVKQTGCRYTGITLSVEQLRFAEKRVQEAGLQDSIKFILCDYRQLPDTHKYDRIISCEMLEAVGHEYMEEFFHCCDSILAKNGLLVLQFISIPDQRYDEYRRSSDFIKEYIFPGGCLPALSRVTSAMAVSSSLCVEHLENIGIHYYPTLSCWKKNFMEHRGKIISLGFDEKFIRTWEYYFDYCIAGFKSRTLGNYQIVLSRPGNVTALGNPFEGESTSAPCS
ncbi:hypothetical protein Nepgr_021762 [Nepenthes gracilis]|uniref:Amine oxidase domain-containing protein n=1 Tax=Nepenthes gracilis TaxID=150966 RepID=A0AAD3XXP8_NEPGR|nr:hypothetical protein Nepgr_021762 [Nepenthes gracilis]